MSPIRVSDVEDDQEKVQTQNQIHILHPDENTNNIPEIFQTPVKSTLREPTVSHTPKYNHSHNLSTHAANVIPKVQTPTSTEKDQEVASAYMENYKEDWKELAKREEDIVDSPVQIHQCPQLLTQ